MHSKIRKLISIFLFTVFVFFLCSSISLSQQVAIKRQTDGTIKIQSTPPKMKVRISNMVYCRTIDELIKEEKDNLNKLISSNRYGEVKDSIEIIEGLRQLKVEKCK
jgi:hypothetical protein